MAKHDGNVFYKAVGILILVTTFHNNIMYGKYSRKTITYI